MRAKEFVISIPITIRLDKDSDDLIVSTDGDNDDSESSKAFVPPLQQSLEIQKAMAGKKSKTISDLLTVEEKNSSQKPAKKRKNTRNKKE